MIPAFERLKSEGKIDAWGIGLGEEDALISAINHEKQPEAMQCAVNVMNSIGAIGYISKKPDPNRILKECQDKEIPILAISCSSRSINLKNGSRTSSYWKRQT